MQSDQLFTAASWSHRNLHRRNGFIDIAIGWVIHLLLYYWSLMSALSLLRVAGQVHRFECLGDYENR